MPGIPGQERVELEPQSQFIGKCQTCVVRPGRNWKGGLTQSLEACGWETGMCPTNNAAWDALDIHFAADHPGVSDKRGAVDTVYPVTAGR